MLLLYRWSVLTCDPVLQLLPRIVDDHEALTVFRRVFDAEMPSLKSIEVRFEPSPVRLSVVLREDCVHRSGSASFASWCCECGRRLSNGATDSHHRSSNHLSPPRRPQGASLSPAPTLQDARQQVQRDRLHNHWTRLSYDNVCCKMPPLGVYLPLEARWGPVTHTCSACTGSSGCKTCPWPARPSTCARWRSSAASDSPTLAEHGYGRIDTQPKMFASGEPKTNRYN